jgi:hypothetical protein
MAASFFLDRQLWAQRVCSVFKNQPFNWFLLAVSSCILPWYQMVIGSKTWELFSPNHVDSIDAALANASGFPLMLLVLLIVKPTKIRILYGHFKE